MATEDAVVTEIRLRIERAIEPPAAEGVAEYFDPENNYAAATFNVLGDNDPNSFGSDDLLAVHLLSMSFKPGTVRRLLDDGPDRDEVGALLRGIKTEVDLWDEEADESLAKAGDLWEMLNSLDGIGWVTAGKLLARKRPRLIPVFDTEVQAFLAPPKGRFWGTLRSALRSTDLPERIAGLRPRSAERQPEVTTLRLLDVAIWMRQKQNGPFSSQ